MKRLLFLILFLFSFSATAEDDHWKELYDFHTTMAARGSVEAEYKLGEMNEAGQGTAKDLQAARDWYLKAAAHGHVGAEYKLGTFYENGIGVSVDREEARRWYEKAAEHGIFMAQRKLKEWDKKDTKSTAPANVVVPARPDKGNVAPKVQQEKTGLEQERKNEAEQLKKKQMEAEKARQAAIARQAAQAREKKARQPVEQKTTGVQKKTDSSQPVATDGGEKESFETDPCKTPAARFMSTCKNK